MNLPYRRALITGISGQDGALLASQLLRAGVVVVGTHRPDSRTDYWRLRELGIADHAALELRILDPLDAAMCNAAVAAAAPDAVFHLAGQSSVAS